MDNFIIESRIKREPLSEKERNGIKLKIEILTPKILSFCRRLTAELNISDAPNDAEDFAQATLQAALEHTEDLRDSNEKMMWSWMCRTATNKILDYLRSKKNHNVSLEQPSDATGVNLYPEEGKYKKEESQKDHTDFLDSRDFESIIISGIDIPRILRELKPENQPVLILRKLEGWSWEEIATETQKPEETIKKSLQRDILRVRGNHPEYFK